MQGARVLIKGECCTRRGASLVSVNILTSLLLRDNPYGWLIKYEFEKWCFRTNHDSFTYVKDLWSGMMGVNQSTQRKPPTLWQVNWQILLIVPECQVWITLLHCHFCRSYCGKRVLFYFPVSYQVFSRSDMILWCVNKVINKWINCIQNCFWVLCESW